MTLVAPFPVDILDFQFKLQCKLRVFKYEDTPVFDRQCSLVAVASRCGLLFVGSNHPYFQVIQLQTLQKFSLKDGEIANYPRRNISLPSYPRHLAVNCDCTKLGVVTRTDCVKVIVYDVSSFLSQNISITHEVRLSANPEVNILETVWNPAIPTIYTVCKDDGSLGMYDLKAAQVEINELPRSTSATCMCWSPKGKQIAVGSRDGKITQYKPDLKVAKVVNSPPLEGGQYPVALQWISNYQFIAVYRPNSTDERSSFIVINSSKVGETTYINYEDICYSCGNTRPHQFYMFLQSLWNILLVASSNSMEIAVLGLEKDIWTQWSLADSARAELPLSATKQDTLPIGLSFDTSSTQPLPWGEGTLPPAPLLLLLSHQGVLCCFYAVNLKEGATQICQPPEVLPINASSLFVTTSFEKGGSLPNKPIPINPAKSTAINAQHPAPTTFSFTFNKPIHPTVIDTNTSKTEVTQSLSKSGTDAQTVQSAFNVNVKPMFTFSSVNENVKTSNGKSETEGRPIKMHNKAQSSQNSLRDEKVTGNISSKDHSSFLVDGHEDTEIFMGKMVKEECAMLEFELKALVKHGQNIKVELGAESEARNLARSTIKLQEFLNGINEILQTQTAEIHYLKQTLVQTWASYEEARSRYATNKDPTLITLVRAQPLDATSSRQLDDIRHILYYLESQLNQAHTALDEQWAAFQDSCRHKTNLKLSGAETIYQSMVKQSATIQKQAYILKDISNRIKTKTRVNTIPHLLVSMENGDTLEQQMKSLHIYSKPLFQLQYDGILKKQKQLSVNKIKKIRNLLKQRHISHVSVSKPQFVNSSVQLNGLISVPFSPIKSDKNLQPKRLFIQSTPKPINNQTHTTEPNVMKSNSNPIFQNENIIKDTNAQLPQDQEYAKATSTKYSENTIPTASSANIFGFGEVKPTPGSAFVPTTQSIFPLKNAALGEITANNTPINKSVTPNSDDHQKPIFSFNTSTSFITCAPSTNTTSSNLFSQVSAAGTDKTHEPSKFMIESSSSNFGGIPKGVPSPVITSPKLNFNFGNLSTTKNDDIQVDNANNKSIFNNTSLPNSSMFFTLKTVDGNRSTASVFTSTKPTAIISSKPLGNITTISSVTSSVTSSFPIFATKMFELSPITTCSKSSLISVPSPSASSSTSISTNSNTIVTVVKSLSHTKMPTIKEADAVSTTSLFPLTPAISKVTVGVTSRASPLSQAESKLAVTTPESTSIPSTTVVLSTTTAITSFFSTPLTATTFSGPNTVFSRSQTIPALSFDDSQQLAALPATEKLEPTSTSEDIANISTCTSNNFMFNVNTNATSNAAFDGSQTFAFGTSNITTPIVTSPTIIQPEFGSNTSSITSNTIPLLFGNTNMSTSTSQSIFGADTVQNSSTPSIFKTSTTSSTVAPLIFGSNTSSSTTPSIFGSDNVSSSSTQSPIFSTNSNSSSTNQTSIFSTPRTSATSGSIFEMPSTGPEFPGTKTSSIGVFGSTPSTFDSVNTTTSTFFTPSTSTAPNFGQSSSFGSGSIFMAPSTTTNTGSIFGVSTLPTNAFESTPTTFGDSTTSNATPFASVFGGSANNPSIFGSGDTFQFSTTTGNNTPNSSGGFAFNKPSFTTFGGNTNSTDTTSLSFGSLGLSSRSDTFNSGFVQNPFGRTSQEQQKSSFSGGSLFGNTPTTSSSNIFGGTSPFNKTAPAFGGPATFGSPPSFQQGSTFPQSSVQGPTFSQNTFSNSGNIFGNSSNTSPFGRVTQSGNQSGFGASPVFGSSSVFASAPVGGFGAPPAFGSSTFGGNTTFNTSNKPFTDTFGASNQQGSTFANLANQQTLGFGSLAQQSTTPTSQSTFSGGSSFSNWR